VIHALLDGFQLHFPHGETSVGFGGEHEGISVFFEFDFDGFCLDWFSKVRAAKGDFWAWISCRSARGGLNVPACERRFLRCFSVVDFHRLTVQLTSNFGIMAYLLYLFRGELKIAL
jgi:hypothetical protein